MKTSESIKAIAAALVKAQAAVGKAVKDSKNPHFKSDYADLESVLDTIHDVAAANGLALLTIPGETVDGRVHFTNRLIHESGEWMEETSSVPIGKPDAQGYGSVTTYVRRYSAAAWFRLRQTDDDGNAAADAARKAAEEQRNKGGNMSGSAPGKPMNASGKGFPSKFPGVCGECGIKYPKDELIDAIPGTNPKKYRHVVCPSVNGMVDDAPPPPDDYGYPADYPDGR